MNENLNASGALTIQLLDREGKVKDERNVSNLVVFAGLAFIASRMRDTSLAVMSHMAIGSNSTPAASNQAALLSELGRVAVGTAAGATNQTVYTATFGPGAGTGAVVEAGIFNAGAGGSMLCRTVFGVVNKGADDTMVITWTVTINA